MRLLPIATLFALSFGALSAAAQVPGADAAPYPVEADRRAAAPLPNKPLTFPATPKVAPKLAAKPVTKPAVAPVAAAPAKPAIAKPEAAKSAAAPVMLPPIKPEAIKAAIAQPAAASPAVAAKGKTDVPAKADTANDVFAGIPQDERLKLQAALLWSGDYTGAVNGEDPMLTAVRNFQKRIKSKISGQLTAAERASLIAAAREHEQEFGWSVVADPATGIRIGLPTKMVPHVREAARGTLWSSAHGEVQVETFRLNEPGLKLQALFEQEKKTPETRKVEYSVLRDDSYFVSGIQGLKKFSVRASIRNGEVRGFTMLFDQAMEGIVAPVMVAMASGFSPFPQRSAPFAALSKSVEYGNGMIVSAQGHIVTDARLTHGCQVIVASGLGDAERVAEDKDHGLALLRVYGPGKVQPLAFARDAAPVPKASDVTLLGIPDPKDQDGRGKLVEITARVTDGNAIELRRSEPLAGFSGAVALDRQGRFVGMAEMRNAVVASTEPTLPPLLLVRPETIRGFLDAQHVPAAAAAPSADASASVVRIICVRK
ncbi:MAG: serine protease [Pseudolabrys sp.]|nr:serine protease [Pseudolabrys sp.]